MGMVAAALVAAAAPSSVPSSVIDPGYWNFRATVLYGLKSEGRQCLQADQISDFVSAPHNKHYRCRLPLSDFRAGALEAEGECADKHGHRYTVKLHGNYTRTSFQLNGTIHGLFFEIPLTAPISLTAERLGDTCPASPSVDRTSFVGGVFLQHMRRLHKNERNSAEGAEDDPEPRQGCSETTDR